MGNIPAYNFLDGAETNNRAALRTYYFDQLMANKDFFFLLKEVVEADTGVQDGLKAQGVSFPNF